MPTYTCFTAPWMLTTEQKHNLADWLTTAILRGIWPRALHDPSDRSTKLQGTIGISLANLRGLTWSGSDAMFGTGGAWR